MSVLAALTTFFLFFGSAVAQINATQCSGTFSAVHTWVYNSLNQNPCEVAAYLQSTCHGGAFITSPLLSGQEYLGPSVSEGSDLCACNTVTYSLISACGACQYAIWIDWPQWAHNCTTILAPGTFPNPIPDGTSVPQWALADVTREDLAMWDEIKAEAIGDTPEIGPGALTNGSTPAPGSRTTGTASPDSTGSPAATSSTSSRSNSNKNTGAIVGGIVGGLAIVVVAVLACVYLFRQRTKGPSVVTGASRPHEGVVGKLSTDEESSPKHEVPPMKEPYPQVPDYPSAFHEPQVASYGPAIPSQPVFGSYQGTQNTLPMRVSRAQEYNGHPIIA